MSDAAAENNIAHLLPRVAAQTPAQRAVVVFAGQDRHGRCAYAHLTFAQLEAACERFSWGLSRLGVGPGTPTLLMVRPGLDFFALTFAIFRLGAVPILIDPGMGWRSFVRCVAQAQPEVLLGIPAAHVLRRLFPRAFRSIRIPVTLGRRFPFGGASTDAMSPAPGPFPVARVGNDDLAAVLFTTGSTGPAKGVQYTHRIFCTQVEILRREYGIGPGDIDLPCFPLFGLFSTALGATAVIPHMDPSRPAQVDPERIVRPILDHGVTYSFGSPTLWARVGRYCVRHGVRLPTLRQVIMAGAPVPAEVHDALLNHVLPPDAQTYTPYGATEALPLCNFAGREMLRSTAEATRQGAGMCVGRPLSGVDLRIIATTDGPIPRWSDAQPLPPGETGEVAVRGAVVTRAYHRLPEADRRAKIPDADGAVWHRMGDVGYVDREGRLWFCGRQGHRVRTGSATLYSVCCEAFFNALPGVSRSALVGVGADRGNQQPVIVIEPEADSYPRTRRARDAFRQRVLGEAAAHEMTRPIRHVLFHRSLPVDIRHNAKIRREVLAEWAAARLP